MLPDIELKTIDAKTLNLRDYEGKVLLVVNVASQCGFTPQYKDLQSLFEEFKDRGFEVLAFPCNQFGAQEPGSAEQITSFCETQFGVRFQLFEKTDVNGAKAHPLFTYLKEHAPGILGTDSIKWNFTKFLIDRSGQKIKRFGSADSVKKIRSRACKSLETRMNTGFF